MLKSARNLIAAVALTLGVGQPAWATVQIVSPGGDVAGQSQLYWAQAWWQWAMGVPQPYDNPAPPNNPVPPYNPLNDPSGQYAGANNNGPVFFLAGNAIAGGVWTRTITVPEGKPVFFPVLNAIYVPINSDGTYGPSPCGTPLTLACALTVPPSYLVGANMAVQIDGISLDTAQIEPFRQTSTSYFSVALPADNVLDVTPIKNYDQCVATGVGQPCSDLWVQDGFYITLDDLSVGTHILQFQAETPGFSLSVTDTLNVVPEPSTWTMMLVGFTGLSFAAYWRRRTQRPPVAVPRRTGTGVDREDRESMTGLYAERQLHL
jgi:hypothetical protein